MEVLRVLLRWIHALSAVAWMGGGLFYLLVLNPALASIDTGATRDAFRARAGAAFHDVVRVAIGLFLLSGTILAFDRLTHPGVTTLYVLVLGLHVLLALTMFGLAQETRGRRRRHPSGTQRRRPRWLTPPYLILALGLAGYLTAIVLREIFERMVVARA